MNWFLLGVWVGMVTATALNERKCRPRHDEEWHYEELDIDTILDYPEHEPVLFVPLN